MPADHLSTIGNYATGGEAHAARLFLDSHGIQAMVVDEALVGNFWQFGNAVGGVKLQVDAADAARARELLAESNSSAADGAERRARPWNCAQCGERVPAGFECCWSCEGADEAPAADSGAAEPEEDSEVFAPVRPSAPVRQAYCPDCDAVLHPLSHGCPECGRAIAPNPYEAPATWPEGAARQPKGLLREQRLAADALATRAWKAAIFGLVCLPPLLSIYSIVLLVTLAERHSRISPRLLRRIAVAWGVNLCVLGGILVFLILR